MSIHIGFWDLALIYAIPLVVFVTTVLVFLIVLYVLVLLPRTDFDFKHDLFIIYDSQRKLKRFRGRVAPFARFYFKTLLGDSGTQALLLYRISRFFLLHGFTMFADAIHRVSKFLTQTDISPYAVIGRGLVIYHGSGVVIGKNTRLGDRCLVCQGVTTGQGAPQIGNDVKLWAGAKVLGNITVGDNSEVGANAVLVRSLESNCIAVGVPANRILRKAV
jgi:serine O-acetyltransferase